MAVTFKIGDHDYSRYIKASGLGWERNDIDAAKSGRTKDGTMRRKRTTTKRKLNVTCLPMPQSVIQALDTDLDQEYITVTYPDTRGILTKTFYGSKISSTLAMEINGTIIWEDTKFNIIEV